MKLKFIFLIISSFLIFHTTITEAGYGKTLCQLSNFYCITIKRGQSWHSLWKNEEERDIVMRINRMNIRLAPGMVIAVPKNLAGKNIMDFSPFPEKIVPKGEKLLIFDPAIKAFAAYDRDGTLLHWGPASGGANHCPDLHRACFTTPGHFRVFSVGGPDCISHKFPLPNGGAPMPYCMFFNHGQAFHGSVHGLPGYNASHSCVRLNIDDAKWLNENFVTAPNSSNHYRGTSVMVGAYPNDE